MNANALPSERVAVLGTVDPDVLTAAAHTSDYVDAGNFESIVAVIMAGTLGTCATLDAKLVQATDSSGTGSKDITGKAITQLVKATDDDKQAVINVRSEELDLANSFTHVALTITVGTASSDGGGVLLGMNPRFGPASDNDLSTVAEIVS